MVDVLSREFLLQGITGKEGTRAAEWMLQSGVRVVAGVTPGKGGEEVLGLPVFNTVLEAKSRYPSIEASSLYVPPSQAWKAVKEAVDAGISFLHLISENVPVLDAARMIEYTEKRSVQLLGPSSVGFIVPGVGMVGSVGGGNEAQFLSSSNTDPLAEGFRGGVCILSKSGGMATTLAYGLTQRNIPQRIVVGTGGDVLIGSPFHVLLEKLHADPKIEMYVLLGEIGGSYEEQFAESYKKLGSTIPVVAYVSGVFAETLPVGMSFGHAGAIVSKREGSRSSKMNSLQEIGAHVVESYFELETTIETIWEGTNGK